jgi:hypothetical protein
MCNKTYRSRAAIRVCVLLFRLLTRIKSVRGLFVIRQLLFKQSHFRNACTMPCEVEE